MTKSEKRFLRREIINGILHTRRIYGIKVVLSEVKNTVRLFERIDYRQELKVY
jgi:hypothetical protein